MIEKNQGFVIRDSAWLEARLELLWTTYFHDVAIGFPITASFGRRARRRFGAITARNSNCFITINALLQSHEAPEYVIDATLVHELAHYAHGYGSGLPKRYADPHRGGVVDAELRKRGCYFLEERAELWRKRYWEAFYSEHAGDIVEAEHRRRNGSADRWGEFLACIDRRREFELVGYLINLRAQFGPAAQPFAVEWLHASLRQTGLSYHYSAENTLRVHGLLADRTVPQEVVLFELAFWMAAGLVGNNWKSIEPMIRQAGLGETAHDGAGRIGSAR